MALNREYTVAKYLTNPIWINSHIYWVKYHSEPSSQQQDV
jgi:hypothetical protein